MRGLAWVCIIALGAAAPAAASTFDRLLPAKSQIVFVSRQMGVPVEGGFKRFSGEIALDSARPEAARATLEVDLASIDVGAREAYDEVVSRNWFDVRQYPSARFVATSIRPLSGERYEVRGQLTLKGRTREIAVPVSLRAQGTEAVMEGSFTLKRLDYGIGTGPWGDTSIVADEVQVRFRLTAGRSAPAPGGRSAARP
ncbi:MAG: YceI family protein [Thiobacillaceae bacterium]|nr:YceI family protein [Thiobacillaceae bacterium]